jgi:hypothetical protein
MAEENFSSQFPFHHVDGFCFWENIVRKNDQANIA